MRNIGVKPETILLEPIGRNTAPAVALAAMIAKNEFNDPLILVLSADHNFKDSKMYINSIEEGKFFAPHDHLVTFGFYLIMLQLVMVILNPLIRYQRSLIQAE